MKSYSLNRIYLVKLLMINFISFIVTFGISILLIRIINKFSGLNLVNLFILLSGIFLTFIVYPWSVRKCSEIIEVKITKNKITIIGKSFIVNEVEKIDLNYRFLRYPQLKLNLKDKRVKSFIIEKYKMDYFDFESIIK